MYYIRIDSDDSNKLIYYCRNCGKEDTNSDFSEDIVVSKLQIKNVDKTYTNIINKYTKLDPTLPRINNILCPNSECTTNTKHTEREIIYIRYDDTNMKYIYLCSTCGFVWETKES
jgi:DNA-directed RNA polymerase subunit M/transcription elongation factor TFIIS